MASTDVLIRLVADVTDLNKEMSSIKKQLENVENTTSKAGSTLTSTFKKVGTVIAGAFAVDKIKDFTKSMIEASASVNALDSMFEQTFKGEQAQALELISKQAQEQGIHVDRLKGTWASFYGTFRGNGADANESLQLTSRYMELAGDASAYYDLTLEDVVSRLKSITMGNFEAGDAIGININATKLNAIATEKLGKKWQDLNDTQKEFLLIDVAEGIYENSGAMGQGSREADNWANVVANLQTVWERLLGTIGQPVLKTAVGIVQNLTSKLEALVPVVQNAGQYVQQLKDWFKEHETVISVVTVLLGSLTTGLIAFNVWLKAGAIAMAVTTGATTLWSTVCGIATTVTTAFGVAMAVLTSPIFLIVAGITAVVGATYLLIKNWDSVKEWASNTWSSVKKSVSEGWDKCKTAVGNAMDGIKEKVSSAWETTKSKADEMVAKTKEKFNEMVQNFKQGCIDKLNKMGFDGNYLVGTFTDTFSKVKAQTFEGMNQIKDTISNTWSIVSTKVQQGTDAIKTVVSDSWKIIKSKISTAMNGIKKVISDTWLNIKNSINGYITGIKDVILNAWNNIKTIISNTMESIKKIISDAWTKIKDTIFKAFGDGVRALLEGDWEGFKQIISNALTNIKAIVVEAWENIKTTFNDALSKIKEIISTAWETVKTNTLNFFNGIKTMVTDAWNKVKDIFNNTLNSIKVIVTDAWDRIKSIFTTSFESIKATVLNAWNRVKQIFTDTLENIKTIVSNAWNGIKQSISNSLEKIKTDTSDKFNKVKTICSTIWEGIKTDLWNKVVGIKDNFVNGFNTAKQNVVDIFENIRSSITNKIQDARDKVRDAIEKIKSFFKFEWSLPKLKLPHLSVSGSFSLSPPSVPKFGIDWYATGGIFTGPSVVGIGEAGDEAVLPLSNKGRMKPFAKAVAGFMPDNTSNVSTESGGVTVSVGNLTVREEADIQRIAQELYKLQERNRRKRGVVYA